MKSRLAGGALLLIASLALMGQAGWDSRTEFQGNHIVAGSIIIVKPAVSVDTTLTLRFPGPGDGDSVLDIRSVFDSTAVGEGSQFQWFSISTFGGPCTLSVYSPKILGDSVVYLSGESVVEGSRSIPPLPVGLDSIRLGIKTADYTLDSVVVTVMVGR